MGMELNYFNNPVNVAIDEHDEPYTGKDNPYLIDAPFHKFRGTDMAYRFATLDCVSSNRFTLAAMVKHQLDGINNAKEVKMLIERIVIRYKDKYSIDGQRIFRFWCNEYSRFHGTEIYYTCKG